MFFRAPDEIEQKLYNSIVVINDKEIGYVRTVGNQGCDYYNKEGNTVRESGRLGEINYTLPKMGYVTVPGTNQLIYISRNPLRRWKFGLAQDNSDPSNLFMDYPLTTLIEMLETIRNGSCYEPENWHSNLMLANKKSFAISPRFAFKKGVLNCQEFPIATVHKGVLVFEAKSAIKPTMMQVRKICPTFNLEVAYEEKKELVYDEDDI